MPTRHLTGYDGSASADETLLTGETTCGLGEMEFKHPPGTFAVTPASLVSLRAIGTHQQLLSGIGIDWGPGSGILSIAAARIEAVTKVYGLEIAPANVEAARQNALLNGVAEKTVFLQSDSFSPLDKADGEKGRWQEVRLPNEKELKATTVLRLAMESASAKVRNGPPSDEEDDYALPEPDHCT